MSILSGVWKGDKKQAKNLISKWINDGKYLHAWGFIFVATDEMDQTLLRKVLNKARTIKDTQALNNVLRSILHHYPKDNNLKSKFIEVIKVLTKLKNTWWVNNLWFKSDSILDDLSKEELATVKKALKGPFLTKSEFLRRHQSLS